MRQTAFRMIVAACAALVLAGTALAGSSSSRSKLKVALILPCPTNDGSWCQQGYVAAKQLQREGLIDLKFTSNAPQDTPGATQVIER